MLRGDTFLLFTLGVILVLLPTPSSAASDLAIENFGYRDVIVTISPDIPPDNANEIIQGIKSWISSGSESLYKATYQRAYVANVKILIPETWSEVEAIITDELVLEDGHIQVNFPNPVYGDAPYTVQTGSCGQVGERIYATPGYFINLGGASTEFYGPPGHVFAHEWSKYRYGVFDEFGYPGDSLYPAFYVNPRNADELLPNFCTITHVKGMAVDMETQGGCSYDETSGLPDDKCMFVPTGDNSFILTSLLATQFLDSTEFYCNFEEELYFHNVNLPNKQNNLCNYQSTWDVVKQSPDIGDETLGQDEAPETEFEIYRQEQGKFVLVLDKSVSMENQGSGDRFNQLKQSTMRWIKNDINSGSELGIVSFCAEPEELMPMTVVTDDNRLDMMEFINGMTTCQATCLGAAVKAGIETMSGSAANGGVMIFFTDGEQSCKSVDDSTITDQEVVEMVLESGIRIITIAIGPDADQDIESLADLSNGKTYFIPDDGGLGNINDALQGSLTYQPAVPTGEVDFVILKEQFENAYTAVEGLFTIDSTIGRDVSIQIDYVSEGETEPIRTIKLFLPDGSFVVEEFSHDDLTRLIVIEKTTLEEGDYTIEVQPRTGVTIDYLRMVVTSKAKDGETLPFRTNCWFSTADGSNEADLSLGDPLGIVAEVMQGNRPVMNARVRAFIERENTDLGLELDLYDNGASPDITANDGYYSRYFTQFDGQTRYLLRCQVEGTDETDVNGGFTATKRYEKGEELVYPLQGAPPCCGSDAFTGNSIQAIPTGIFRRESVGGSIRISNVGTNDVFPPSQVTDLRAAINLEEDTIKLSFTAPGDDYNAGTASRYQLFSSADSFALVTEDFSNENVTEIKDEDLSSGTLLPVLGNSEVVLTLAKSAVLLSGGKIIRSADQGENNLYFRMKFYDEGDNQSSSNIDSVSLGVPSFPEPEESSTTTTTTPTTTTTTSTTTASTTANPTDSTTQTTITDAPSTTTSSTETPMASSTTTTTTVGTTTSDAPTLSTTSKESTTTTDSEPSTTALSGAQNYLQSSFLAPLSLLFSLSFIF